MRVARFRVKNSHPDFLTARSQLVEARRLFNSLNAVAREASAHYHDPDADTHIIQELGLESWLAQGLYLGNYGTFESIRKTIEEKQGITLSQKVAQHVAREVANCWQSFYRLRKVKPHARPPRFKRQYGLVQFTKQAVSAKDIRNGVLRPTGWTRGVKLPAGVKEVQAARLLYQNGNVWLEVMHKTPRETTLPSGEFTAAIDLGLDNLATIIVNKPGYRPLIIDGKHLKSVNRDANKRAATHRSKLDIEGKNLITKHKRKGGEKVEQGKIPSIFLDRLWGKRNRCVITNATMYGTM